MSQVLSQGTSGSPVDIRKNLSLEFEESGFFIWDGWEHTKTPVN